MWVSCMQEGMRAKSRIGCGIEIGCTSGVMEVEVKGEVKGERVRKTE